MDKYILEEIKYVLYDKEKKRIMDINTDPLFEDYGVVFNLAGQVLLTCEGQIVGYLGDRYELRKKSNNKTKYINKKNSKR